MAPKNPDNDQPPLCDDIRHLVEAIALTLARELHEESKKRERSLLVVAAACVEYGQSVPYLNQNGRTITIETKDNFAMREVNMTTTDILSHMKSGARLYRGFGDKIELRLSSGIIEVPVAMFDALKDQHQIVAETGQAGFYRLA